MDEQSLIPKQNPSFRSKSSEELLENFEDAKLREKYSATCTLESNVEHIKTHLKKISKALHGMSKSMEDYCKEAQLLCDLLNNFSWTASNDDKEPIITKCANVLSQITRIQLSSMEQMNEILSSGIEKHLADMKENSLREAQQQVVKARDSYDTMHRRLKTGEKRDIKKSKEFELGKQEFEKKNLDYLNKLRDIQTICRFDFTQRLCALMFSYFSFLNQEAQLINSMKTELNDVMTTMEHAKQDYLKNKDNEDHRISLYVKVSQEKGLAKQGYLYKQGKTGRWALRYVVLKEGQVYWFKRWKQQTQTGGIDLLLCAVKPVTETEKPFCFEIVSPNRRITFKALNQVDFQDWLEFIQNSINYRITKNAMTESEGNKSTSKSQIENQTKVNTQNQTDSTSTSLPQSGAVKGPIVQLSKPNENNTISTETSNTSDNKNDNQNKNATENPPLKIVTSAPKLSPPTPNSKGPLMIIRSATNEALRERTTSRERRAATVVVPGPSDAAIAELCLQPTPLLSELRKLNDTNNYCADCGAEDPDWVCINVGSIICIDCSGVHRSLGTQYSKIRSLVMDTFKPEVITYIKTLNNRVVNQILEEVIPPNMTKITKTSDPAQRQEWITLKYKERRFVKPATISQEELNKNCLTALREEKFRDALRFFLQGADLKWANKDDHQKTMAHYFVEEGNLVALLFVLLNGADALQVDDSGKSPLDYAKEKLSSEQNPSEKLKEIVRLLQEYWRSNMRESPRTDLNDTKSSLSQSPITGRQNRSNSVSGRQKRTTKRSPIDLFNYLSPKKKKDKKRSEKDDSDRTLESSESFSASSVSESASDVKSTGNTTPTKSSQDNNVGSNTPGRSDVTGLKAIRLRFHRRFDTQPKFSTETRTLSSTTTPSNTSQNASSSTTSISQSSEQSQVQVKQTTNTNPVNVPNTTEMNNNNTRPLPFAPASSKSPYAFSTLRKVRPLPERPNVLTIADTLTAASRKIPLPPPRSPKKKPQLPPLPVKISQKSQSQFPLQFPSQTRTSTGNSSQSDNNNNNNNNNTTQSTSSQSDNTTNRPPSLTKALSSMEVPSFRSKNTNPSPPVPPPSPAPVPVPLARPKKMPTNAIRHFNAPFNNTTNTFNPMRSEPQLGIGRGHRSTQSLVTESTPVQTDKQ